MAKLPHQSGSRLDAGDTLRLTLQVGRGEQLGHDQVDHAVVDETDQPEALRNRNDVAGAQQGAVAAHDPHQAFMEHRLARNRFDHRLERNQDATLVERCDDLVGRAHVLAAHGFALDARPIGEK